jgi:hypothetical protein
MSEVSAKTEAEDLSRQLTAEFKKRAWTVGLILPVLLGPTVITSEILFRFFGLNISGNRFYWWTGLIISYMLVGIAMIVRLVVYPSARARRAALKLAKTSYVNAIPGLIDSLELQHRMPEIRASLVDLLPKLRRDDVHLFSKRHLAVLTYITLWAAGMLFKRKYANHEELVLPCLLALGQIGDRRCLKSLQSALVWGSKTEKGLAIRAEMEKVCEKLRTTIEEEEKDGTLMRPASAFSDDSTMLRPASNSTGDADSLLRPIGEQVDDAYILRAETVTEAAATADQQTITRNS